MVAVYVSRLRKTLGDDIVLTRRPGYLLQVGPDQVDATRFERLLAEGREALADGDADSAVARLGEALALWRGPALVDFAYEPFAQAEIARLEELRLQAEEERIEAELALGRGAELVAELETLVATAPLRERRRAQHMLALYRSGRQADALSAYQEAGSPSSRSSGSSRDRNCASSSGGSSSRTKGCSCPGRLRRRRPSRRVPENGDRRGRGAP